MVCMPTMRRPQVERERSATTVLLGLSGFVVLAVSEYEGELEQAVETTADLVGCPSCGAVAAAHGRRPVRVRDLPSAGRPVTLIWVRRIWRCRHPQCETTWSETSEAIAPRTSLTERARAPAALWVGRHGESVSCNARSPNASPPGPRCGSAPRTSRR